MSDDSRASASTDGDLVLLDSRPTLDSAPDTGTVNAVSRDIVLRAASVSPGVPLHVLPNELLARAFRFAFLGPRFLIRDPSRRREVVASVCWLWRGVIDRDPESWSCVVVDYTTPVSDVLLSFERSASVSLSLELDCRMQGRSSTAFLDTMVPQILPQFPRCRELCIRAPHSSTCLDVMGRLNTSLLPILVDVRFELAVPMVPLMPSVPGAAVPYLANGVLPRLSSVSFTYGFPVWPWAQSGATLTVVRLARMNHIVVPRLIELHDFLRACPNLVFLSVHYVDAAPPKFSGRVYSYTGRSIVLPCLERLDVSFTFRRAIFVVSPITSPVLQRLSLSISDPSVLDAFVLHAGHLLLKVEALRLAANFTSYPPLEVLLRCMPSLTRLDARLSSSTFVECFHRAALFAGIMSPALRCVALGPFPWPLVQDVLLHRHWSNFDSELCLLVPGIDIDLPASSLAACRVVDNEVVVGEHVDSVDWMDVPAYPSL
ncbi:hypothetical protein R3P38DRAFT_3196820 [Favolaschia claudopus]|uniref:F-box domain-containing protein n=1 Tax=Favolaschia claudopus TaxID=2862362 RepID=A0AAW0B666_9AGAR